jgi:myo-inositol catabolism protein IolC
VNLSTWRPSKADPLLILAMDHRESFGRTHFGVLGDDPTEDQRSRMAAAKYLIYAGLLAALPDLPGAHAGVLVDERYGAQVARAAAVHGDTTAYDREVRPDLVVQVIADNQNADVEPAIWKIEGLEDAEAARAVIAAARAHGRDSVDCVVLGRAASPDRLRHWLRVAAPVDGFVGFAIGRNIWDTAVTDHEQGRLDDAGLSDRVRQEYLSFARCYLSARNP